MSFALIKAAKAVSPQRLHDADVNVGIVVLHELFALKLDETGKHVEIMFEQLLAQLRRQIRFGVVQKRGNIATTLRYVSTTWGGMFSPARFFERNSKSVVSPRSSSR